MLLSASAAAPARADEGPVNAGADYVRDVKPLLIQR
jgi:hypothetical protein